MSDDFDDLFRRDTSSSRPNNNAAPDAMTSSSFAAFGDGDDFTTSNPFADLQSSRAIYDQPSERVDEVEKVTDALGNVSLEASSPARSDGAVTERNYDGVGNGHGWGDRSNSSEGGNENENENENDVENDRVLVSPFVSNPGSSAEEDEVDPMASSTGTATGTSTGFEYNHYGNESEDFNPYSEQQPAPVFSIPNIEDDEDARGFADRLDVPEHTTMSVDTENDGRDADAASIRTVGLESDAASLRSQRTTQTLIHATPSPYLAPLQDDPSGHPTFLVTVSDPTKIGSAIDPINSHTVYTIRTRTSSTQFRKQDFSVLRRFRDFLWLNERLNENNPGVIVPPPPEKAVRGRFDQNFVEIRRLALQTCLQQTLKHPLLYTDPDLRTFLESDTFSTDIKHRQHGSALGGSMSSSFIGGPASTYSTPHQHEPKPSFFSSLTSPRFAEFDEFFDQRRTILDALEVSLKSLTTSLMTCTRTRLSVSASTSELSASYTSLASCELSDNLKTAVRALAENERKRAEVAEAQARDEEHILLAVADQYSRLITSVRAALQGRIRVYQAYQRSESNLKSLRQSHEKLKSRAGRTNPDLVTQSLFEITEAERRCISLKKDFEDISRLLKTSEWGRFEGEKVADFKTALDKYAAGLVARQREVTEGWRKYVQVLEGGLGKGKGKAGVNAQENGEQA